MLLCLLYVLYSTVHMLTTHTTYQCAGGASQPTMCRPGTASARVRMDQCKECEAGRFVETFKATGCVDCERGSYCVNGSSAPLPCPGGRHADMSLPVMTSLDQCIACAEGSSCPVNSFSPTKCKTGTFGELPEQEVCTSCSAGRYQDEVSQTACKISFAGYYAPNGSATPIRDR